MKQSLALKLSAASFLVLLGGALFAQQPKRPADPFQPIFEEAKVPKFELPDPLVTLSGEKVADIKTWKEKRRPEILKLFEIHVYGRTMVGRPEGMAWEVTSEDRKAVRRQASTKRVTIDFTGKKDGPKMQLHITLPVGASKPVPVFLVPGGGNPNLLDRGYGLATFTPGEVEPDGTDGSYERSIRKVFSKPGQTKPGPDEWGAIGAWAWATSRAMDYLVTDKDIDAKKVCIMGVGRYGKVVMWAGAQDERFAIVFSGESGCGGAGIVRRRYGETLFSINAYAPHWFDADFKAYGGRENDLPVDFHMLVALMAPRPVYIATAEHDQWGDPRGAFLSGKFAEPVYRLFGEHGLGVDDMPALDTPVGDTIGYHNRRGAHGLNDYDWQQFLAFADRHFGLTKTPK
jgi:hypothetical protein